MPYLDHAATTPMRPEAIAAMAEQFGDVGNASSLHAAGRRARRVVEESRERIASLIGARPGDVVFTAGGTESDNLAVKGLYWAQIAKDDARRRILTSSVEHHALLDPLVWLAQDEGADVVEVDVDARGRLDLDALEVALGEAPGAVAVISVMLANNEVGTVQPVADVVELARQHGIPVHTDAVQAVGQLDVDFGALGVDAMSMSAHKLGGPAGIGALVLGRDADPVPLLHGGGQERDVRSGTLDVPAIAGFAAALDAAAGDRVERNARVGALRDRLITQVLAAVPDAVLNGDERLDERYRLPNNAHFSFPGCEGDSLLLLLDAKGIECSTGSACSAGIAQPSHVLLAMGARADSARSSLRFSLGWNSSEADVDAVAAAIGPAVERARLAAGAVRPSRA
jgi:cysteine desulfurase